MRNKTRPKIFLLADDDPEDLEMLEESLLAADPEIQLAMVRDGQQALEYLESHGGEELPCFIVLDYKMTVFNAV